MDETNETDSTALGGNITLVGFKDIDRAEIVVVKKIVGSYTRKLSDTVQGFEGITVTLKFVHRTEGSEKYEFHAKALLKGSAVATEVVDRNLFVGLDDVLKKLLILASKE